ncbi:MAG: hypothetical protein QF419_07570 [Acidimicrobiales bacterium]|jgi:hypothetical protein|nr:hypothetical protein [Acidimicrobiaceae bacterium]MDP7259210.1 hypothetical protein [Acidimicrobiales bacterium]HJO80309.1 hypothetical protein [Acidimicrobiales bacterium]
MTTVLSIHLGPNLAHAAVDSGDRIDLLALGEVSVHMPVVLHVSTGGSVTVGLEARQKSKFEPEGTVDNVVGRLLEADTVEAMGRVLPAETVIAHLLAHIYARCLVILDRVPDEVLVVCTAGGPEAAVYAGAAERARLGEFTLVEETRSWSAMGAHGPTGMDPDLAGALGALFWHRHGDGPRGPKPIVTSEDLGVASKEPVRIPTEPSVMSIGSRSVFDESSIPDLKRRWFRPGRIMAVVMLAVLAAGAGFLLSGSEDAGPDQVQESEVVALSTMPNPPTTLQATTAPPASTTTVPPAPTTATTPATVVPGAIVSTTLPPALTTTTLFSTTTTTTLVATTTTRPPLGMLTLSPVGVVTSAATGAEGLVGLGDDSDTVVAVLTAVMGPPAADTDWVQDGDCEGELVRRVTFGHLEVVLSDVDTTDGEAGANATFTQWFAEGTDALLTSLWTFDRIGVGSSVADLVEVYGEGLVLTSPVEGDTAGLFSIGELGVSDGMWGVTTHTSDIGRVLQIWAGEGCERWPN